MVRSECAPSTVEERREFHEELRERDDVVGTDFSRDGFATIFVELDRASTGFHQDLQERAARLGYGIEHLNGAVYRLEQP